MQLPSMESIFLQISYAFLGVTQRILTQGRASIALSFPPQVLLEQQAPVQYPSPDLVTRLHPSCSFHRRVIVVAPL